MKQAIPLAEHLAPDTVTRLERAAELRHDDGIILMRGKNRLGAIYFFGHSAEMCLAAAYFRAAGFTPIDVIDRDTRVRHMTKARKLLTADGKPLMNGDPHPVPGWARFLLWQRSASKLSDGHKKRLEDAVWQAELLYNHWRPELRYKTNVVSEAQLTEVLKTNTWILEQRGRL